MRMKLIIFLIILAVVLGIAGFFAYQKNIYSKEVLKLEILGPETAEAGQEVEYTVKYKNNGNIRLEKPKLIFEYPKNSLLPEEKSQRAEIILEDIYPGQEQTFNFKTRLLGKENDKKEAKAWLSYQPKNLQARYESATTFTTVIKFVPLTLNFDLSSRVEPGKDIIFRLNYFSNFDYPLTNLRIKTEYPFGFEFKNAKPKALEKTEWEIGLLNKTEGGRIEISGQLRGEAGEQKIFRAELGIWQEGEFILLKETAKGIAIAEPSLYIAQQINGNPHYAANPGDQLHYEIFFRNIGSDSLTNLVLIVRLEGKAFDFNSIKAPLGEFESGDNSIIFEGRKVPELQFLDVGEEKMIEFWINLKKDWEIISAQEKNPVIKNKIYLSQVKEEFETKVNSKLVIEQKGYFGEEVFGNSGSIPPRVGDTTTYTIIWQAKNYFNNVKNVKVKATLPSGVRLTGKIFPEGETSKLTFDSLSREIVWEIGNLEPGQGILTPAPNIAFQIAFIPDDSQRGMTPELISEAKISGEDSWTEKKIEDASPAINTTLPDDPTINEEEGKVQ